MAILEKHTILEKNATLLMVCSLLVVTVGGIVEIAPLFYLENTIEEVDGVRPYSPLELEGREVYLREGCYVCHSQMVRPMRDEVERYGHYSLAAESMYDHPFQWGSKRTGPDLARVGGRYSDDWHVAHFIDPQSVVPESVMPKYGYLKTTMIEPDHIDELMATHRIVGVPYTDDAVGRHELVDVIGLQHGGLQVAVFRHYRFRHHRLRVVEMRHVPVIRVTPADAREIRPGALGAPLERVVVHRFRRQ